MYCPCGSHVDACFLVVISLVAMSQIKVTINHFHAANVIFAACVYIGNFNFPSWSHPSPHFSLQKEEEKRKT
jgi:hypothetical protein